MDAATIDETCRKLERMLAATRAWPAGCPMPESLREAAYRCGVMKYSIPCERGQ